MQGDVVVESEVGKGSCFIATLRLREAACEDEMTKPQEEEQADMEAMEDGRYRGCRILLVEDNEINREILKELLEFMEIIVEEAENGRDAVECIFAHPSDYYHLVFMDIQMPVMNGYEAVTEIRRREKETGSHISIVAMTANAFSEDINRAFAAGMDDYLAKPVEIPKIIAALHRWIQPGDQIKNKNDE